MTATLLLRIASVIAFLFAGGHTLGGRKNWSPMGDNDVLAVMRSVRFETMGVSRTYLDFYQGFGYSLSVMMVLQAVLLWQFAALARTNPVAIRPFVVTNAVAALLVGAVAWRLLFPVPAMFSVVLFAFLAAAIFVNR